MEELHFAVSLPSQNEYQRMQAANAVEAGKQLGIEVSVLYADSNAIQQSQQVLDLIQRSKNKPNRILLEALTSVGLERASQAAHDAGIGWVVLNADVDYVHRRKHTSNIIPKLGRGQAQCYRIDHLSTMMESGSRTSVEHIITPTHGLNLSHEAWSL